MNDLVLKFIIAFHLSLISIKPLGTNYLGFLSSKPQLEVPLGQQYPPFDDDRPRLSRRSDTPPQPINPSISQEYYNIITCRRGS